MVVSVFMFLCSPDIHIQRGGDVVYIYVFVLEKHKIGLDLRLVYVKLT